MADIYTLGVDIGSTASKCLILKNGKDVIEKSIVFIGAGTAGPERAINEVLKKSNIKKDDLDFIVATGYGRNTFSDADDQISELSCHAKGATFLFSDVKTIIDIGGQDAKVIHIGDNSKMSNFLMNDKCAAGTGRFLEVMARILDVDIADFSKLSEKSKNHIDISSTCTVFAETEVVSHLAKAVPIEDIIAGIHRSIANRVGNLAKRIGVEPDIILTGGVAHDKGIIRALEDVLQSKIYSNEFCQLNGALGAAVYGYEIYKKESE